jgi:hypothetical protein
MTVGFGLVVHNANGGRESFSGNDEQSRLSLCESTYFRGAKDDIYSQSVHLEDAFSENDSRPLPQNATLIHLPVVGKSPKRATSTNVPEWL